MEKYCKAIAATIASGSSKSNAIDVSSFKLAGVELPDNTAALASGSVTVYLEGSDTSTGTFYALKLNDVKNITSASSGLQIATVDMFVPNFVKVCLSANTATAAGYAARVHVFY